MEIKERKETNEHKIAEQMKQRDGYREDQK